MINQTSSLESSHFPVMLNEIIELSSPLSGGKFIDCTFGVGGYSKELLKFSKTKVLVTGKVDKFTEGKIAVPVHLVNLPEHLTLSVFPKEIPVVFYTSLSAYNSIDRNDFRIECDYNTLDLSSNVMIPKLVLYPKSAKMAELQINSLEYVITKKND